MSKAVHASRPDISYSVPKSLILTPSITVSVCFTFFLLLRSVSTSKIPHRSEKHKQRAPHANVHEDVRRYGFEVERLLEEVFPRKTGDKRQARGDELSEIRPQLPHTS